MSSTQGRASSPAGRRIVTAGRTSTAGLPDASFYDKPTTRTTRDYLLRTEHAADGTRLVAVRSRSPPRKDRNDDYHRRARVRTNSMDLESRPSLSLTNPRAPAKSLRPIIATEAERPSSSLAKTGGAQLEAAYIVPASSSGRHHQRHSSLTAGDNLPTRDRDRDRELLYPSTHAPTAAPTRSGRDGRDYNYEYTTPKEQVFRDLAPPQRRIRSGSHAGARPTSMIDLDYNRHENFYGRPEREGPPASSTRGFEGINRKESLKSNSRLLDDELGRRESLRRYPRDERSDPKYRDIPSSHASSRDDYEVYPSENARHSRPRQPTIEIEPRKNDRGVVEERDDRDLDHHRKHYHYPRDPADREDRHDRHQRRDHDERDERSRRKDHDEREERERRRGYDPRHDREPRRAYDDKDEKDFRRHREDREERERRREYDEREREHRTRDQIRDRERRDEDSAASSHHGLLPAGGTAAAAGLAAEGVRRHRHKDESQPPSKDPRDSSADLDRDRDRDRVVQAPTVPLTEEEEREERRRRRRNEREREEREELYGRVANEGAKHYEPEEREPLRIEAPPAAVPALREQNSYERPFEGAEPRHRRRRRRHRRRSPSRATDSHGESSDSSDSDASDDQATRQPSAVSPPNDNIDAGTPKIAPKGILKRPKVQFPEEPATVREGVAPLDAAKKGIPSEARWTRINRRLVNPEALEQANVRFEEYPDYVIALKVLSPEDISKFTRRTHEIREKRRLEQGSQGSGSGGASNLGDEIPPA